MSDITRAATHAWADGTTPALSATNLNALETDMTAVFAQANTARSTAEAATRPTGLPSYATALGLTTPWSVSLAALNLRPANRHLWISKLAKAADNAASVHVGWMGDSLLIGYDGAGYDKERAIPRRYGFSVARLLGNPYVTTGVTLAKTSIADLGDRWTLTGTWTASGANCLQGTTAGTATWVTPDMCTNLEVYYHNASVGFTYTIDGGSPVTVTPTGASTIGKISLSSLTYGFHTIVLTFAATGAIVCGQRCWTPALNQIHVHNLALGGSRANGGVGQQNWSNTSTLAPTGLGWMGPAMLTSAGVTLDGLFIEAGDNDIFSGGEDAPTTITGLTTMHGYFSTVPTWLVRPYSLPGTSTATADALAAAMMTLAESVDAVFASWDEIVGRTAGTVADSLLGADSLHPTFPHQQLAASYLADVSVGRSYANPGRFTGVCGLGGGRFKLIEAAGTYPARPNVPAGWVDYVGADQPGDWLDGDTWDDLP